mgnify:CR=1 FL=1
MLKLANILTLSRLVLAPVFVVLFVLPSGWAAVAALGTAAMIEMTDLLDGFVARRLGQVSSLGKLIDPLADSISRFSVFLAFTTDRSVAADVWPVLLVVLIFYRDTLVAYTRTFAASSGIVLAARLSGKLKALVQGAGILSFLAWRAAAFYEPSLDSLRRSVFYAVMIPIVLVTVWSAFDYVLSNWAAILALSHPDSRMHRL